MLRASADHDLFTVAAYLLHGEGGPLVVRNLKRVHETQKYRKAQRSEQRDLHPAESSLALF